MASSGEGLKTNFLSDNRMFTMLQQIEGLVTTNASSLKHLRPYVNGELLWMNGYDGLIDFLLMA